MSFVFNLWTVSTTCHRCRSSLSRTLTRMSGLLGPMRSSSKIWELGISMWMIEWMGSLKFLFLSHKVRKIFL